VLPTVLAYALVLVAAIAGMTAILIFVPEKAEVAIPVLITVVTSVLALLRANTAATTSQAVQQETREQTRTLDDVHAHVKDIKDSLESKEPD